MNRIKFMNIYIDNVTTQEAISIIKYNIMENKRMYIVTPNVDHIVKLQENETFLKAYLSAGLIAVDGTPIMFASKWFGSPLKEKITGPRLTENVIRMAAENKYSVFFLGAGHGVADMAAKNMLCKYPGVIYAGSYSPKFGFENDKDEIDKIINIINSSYAQIVITGMGSPKTEILLSNIYDKLNANVSMSIGAAIDFMAGNIKRCPEWINKIGMEWFYRFIKDYKRMWRRYFVEDIKFFSLIVKEKKNIRREKMKLVEMKKVDFSFSDNRGTLNQLVHNGYEQVNVLFTKKGVERGGHFHKDSVECFFVVSGSVNVTAQLNGIIEHYSFKKDDFFQINKSVIHSMSYPEDCILVAMYDKCVEREDGYKDIFPE